MEDKKAIMNRIKHLMRHAESAKELGSLAEAEEFAKKANELLLKYNIEMSEIAMMEDSDEFKNYIYGEEVHYQDNQSGSRWRLDLVSTLCQFNFTSYTYRTGRRYDFDLMKSFPDPTFRVYGEMSNVEVVVWMYHFLSIGLLRMAQEEHVKLTPQERKKYNRYAFLKDFLIGAVDGIHSKLQTQRDKQMQEAGVYGLVKYNAQQLDKFIKENAPKLKTVKSKVIMTGSAYGLGYEAGQNYNITKPLAPGNKSSNQKKLN